MKTDQAITAIHQVADVVTLPGKDHRLLRAAIEHVVARCADVERLEAQLAAIENNNVVGVGDAKK